MFVSVDNLVLRFQIRLNRRPPSETVDNKAETAAGTSSDNGHVDGDERLDGLNGLDLELGARKEQALQNVSTKVDGEGTSKGENKGS